MRPLILGAHEKAKLQQLRDYATEHPFTWDDLLDVFNGVSPAPGDRKGYSCMIPMEFKVVFTLEHQKNGMARHLSISVPTKGRTASPEACNMIMAELGFKASVQDKDKCYVYLEGDAVNVVEYI